MKRILKSGLFLCVAMVLCFAVFATDVSAAPATIAPGETWHGVWDSETTNEYVYLQVDETGYYDVFIKDNNRYATLFVDINNAEYQYGEADCWDRPFRYSGRLSSSGYTYKNLYLNKDYLYEIACQYQDDTHEEVFICGGNIELTVTKNDYQPTVLSLDAGKTISAEENSNYWLTFTTGEAGAYHMSIGAIKADFTVYEKDTGKSLDWVRGGETIERILRLKENTEYIVCAEVAETKNMSVSISKSSVEIDEVTVVSDKNASLWADELFTYTDGTAEISYQACKKLNFQVAYSDGTSKVLSFQELEKLDSSVNVAYLGEYYTANELAYMKAGKQKVSVECLGKKTTSYITVRSYVDWVAEMEPVRNGDTLTIEYDSIATEDWQALYWYLIPDEANIYEFYSSDWDSLSYYITFFDKNNRPIAYTKAAEAANSGYYLKKGEKYALEIVYMLDESAYSDVTCTFEPLREHVHSYQNKVTQKATTSKDGQLAQACKYCGYVKKTTKIAKVSSIALSTTKYMYDGKVKTPAVVVKDANGNTLKKDTDYTVKYASGRKNNGKYAVTVTLQGKYSGTKTLYFEIQSKPAAPTNFKASLTGHNDVKLTWTKSGGTTHYYIYYKKASGSKYTLKTKATGSSYTFSNLSSNTKYNFQIVAYNISGNKTVKGESTAVLTFSTTRDLSAPKKVTPTLYGYDDVKVSWSKVKYASAYKVYFKAAADKSYTYLGSTTGTSMKKADLADGVKYTFKVCPCIKVNGAYYTDSSTKTGTVTTLKKVSTPKVAKSSSSKVKVSWSDISGESGYQIGIYSDSACTKLISSTTTSGKSKTVTPKKGTPCYYRVRAYKTVSGKKIYGPWSAACAYTLFGAKPTSYKDSFKQFATYYRLDPKDYVNTGRVGYLDGNIKCYIYAPRNGDDYEFYVQANKPYAIYYAYIYDDTAYLWWKDGRPV